MPGETNLAVLLKNIEPLLNAGEYVFCTINNNSPIDNGGIIGLFREKEGITIIVEKSFAIASGIAYNSVCSWITLSVHSSLEAVGLTAAFSKALSNKGISCNVVAGYCHDHIFVPIKDTEKAMSVLHSLSSINGEISE
ncbi:MAG TPA: ACT domain-containing protein [Flavisolibacter sp.]|nr:ACT domain-containing protein [Flavisolibacter sp.]